ncbi:class I SAM-dependent methyltransferase [Paractinoplanes toevensis]|nr:class I SAM-dependent methyltransferase [Actinoplanes toevensis]
MTESHHQRQAAESFGAEAERYDRARPSYPQQLIHRIVENSTGPHVLDVGTGTGIAARQLEIEEQHVLGLDVDPLMAEQARRQGLEVEVSKFEDWDPRGRQFDTVVAAQAWHWVDPIAGATKAAGILTPAGRIALIWNVMEPEPAARKAFAEVNASVLPDFPNLWSGDRPILELYGRMFETAEHGLEKSGDFTHPERWRVDWDRAYGKQEWLDQLPTFGGMSRLPKGQVDELLAMTATAIGDSFVMHYTTVAVTATRK